jgi:hypothetical protein
MNNKRDIQIAVEEKLHISSYNLSAQVVFSYLSGYSCKYVKSAEGSPLAGITAIDYKEDAEIIEHLLKGAELEYFAELNKASKLQVMEAAEKLAKIIVAGTAAESIYENGGYINETLNIKLHFLDLMKVQYINYILTHIDPHHSPEFIKNTVDEVLMLMAKPKIWQAIDALAGQLIISSPQVNEHKIKEIVEGHLL